jgi:hypothetical protein
MTWDSSNLNRTAELRHIMECKREEPVCDCEFWGENRADELFIDVGCTVGYAECKHEQCPSYQKVKPKDIHCNFCGGELGDVEHQVHSNPNFAEYRTCLKCGYQWAKEYWAWLARVQGVGA